MTEHPILFTGAMVRVILAGPKTETRRVVKPKLWSILDKIPRSGIPGSHGCSAAVGVDGFMCSHEPGMPGPIDPCGLMDFEIPCPYGVPGDRLWVRETFVLESTDEYPSEPAPTDRPCQTLRADHPDDFYDYLLIPHYRATEPDAAILPGISSVDGEFVRTAWKPSIHMPRWASRITLEVEDVIVERVQDIAEAGAVAEGWPKSQEMFPLVNAEDKARKWFLELWNSINGKRGNGWDVNPWVWVVKFRLLEPDAHGNPPSPHPMPCSACGKMTTGVSGKVTKCALCRGAGLNRLDKPE